MSNFDKIAFATILIVATQVTRLIPLMLEKHIQKFMMSENMKTWITDIFLILLILYCFRDISYSSEYFLRLVVSLYVFIVQYKFERTLLSIFSGSIIYIVIRSLI